MATMTLAQYDEATSQNIEYWKGRLTEAGRVNSDLKDEVLSLRRELTRTQKDLDQTAATLRHERMLTEILRVMVDRMEDPR